MMMYGLVLGRLHHFNHRLTIWVHGDSNPVPKLFNFTEHQAFDLGIKHAAAVKFDKDLGHFRTIQRIGLRSSEISFSTICILGLLLKLHQIEHVDGAFGTRLEEAFYLFFRRRGFIFDLHSVTPFAALLVKLGFDCIN